MEGALGRSFHLLRCTSADSAPCIARAEQILCELLEVWHAHGDKVLIFSMSLKIIGLLKSMMDTTRYRFLTLDGSTPQDDRASLVTAQVRRLAAWD